MSLSSNFPTIKPTLLLDFANTKQLDPRITFTRASTATYYDGKTVAMAEQNLFISSQEFDGGDWTKTETTVTANVATAPDGTSTAEQMIETTATSNHRIQQNISAVNGFTYAISIFAKKGVLASARNFIQLAVPTTPFGTNAYANFDILNGTIPTQGAGLVSAAISNAGNGWYRCSIVVTATSTITAAAWIQIAQSGTGGILPSYAGSTSADVLLWGAQAEQRSAVTAYTATTTAAITNYIPVLMTAASGVARFDNNPTTDESLGLLIEESRTNLLTYSADYTNAAWVKTNATITADTIVAPDGTLTGDKLVEDTTTSTHQAYQNFVGTVAAYTFSVYAKAGERTVITLLHGGGNSANYDLVAGTATGTGASIVPVGNGWYRCIITQTLPDTANRSYAVRLNNGSGVTYAGNGFSGAFIWGAQLEAGAFATSYIPTTTATVTRAADAASMTGTNFSSWYTADQGTIYAAVNLNVSPIVASSFLYTISEGVGNERIGVSSASGGGGNINAIVVDNGSTQAQTINTGVAAAGSYKYANAYKVNDFASVVNGGAAATDTLGTLPTVDRLNIGSSVGLTAFTNGTISKLAFYPQRLTNAQLVALTF